MNTLIPEHEIEPEALQQIYNWLNLSFLKKLAIMPDVHTGYSLPIGGVALLNGVISPVAVGYDIGCGMISVDLKTKVSEIIPARKDQEKIYKDITNIIPLGFNIFQSPKFKIGYFVPSISTKDSKRLKEEVDKKLGKSLGTLGGGNHFIELGSNREGNLCVTIHSGSRNPGHQIGRFYMNLAKDTELPNGFFALESELGQAYYQDMNYMLWYALQNRRRILEQVLNILGFKWQSDFINENHNHAVITEDGILHRKGATPAKKDQLGVIPGNMRDGVYITKGLGNTKYLCSASHGAGRKGSRKWAKNTFNVESFRDSMGDVIGRFDEGTLDECPQAYKDFDTVVKYQEGVVVEIIDYIKPIINVKG